jgi:hypothetical protein
MNRLPVNGQTLLDLRRRKLRPEGVTLVSFIGFLSQHSNFQVCGDPDDTYDWSPLAGLEVEVMASKNIPMVTVLRQLACIAVATPAHMVLTFVEGPRIECGRSRVSLISYNPNVRRMGFDWFPMAVGPSHLEDALKIEKRMWDEFETNPFDTNEKRVVAKMIKELDRGNDD